MNSDDSAGRNGTDRRRVKRWVLALAASVVVIGGLAFAGYRIYLNEAHDDAVKLAPPNTLLYANAFLNPSTHQKQALRDLLEKFPGAGDPDEDRGALERYLDAALVDAGIDFSHDIEPWLGREVAVALLPPFPPTESDEAPNAVLYLGTSDGAKAMSAVRRANEHTGVKTRAESYRGVDYLVNEDERGAAGIVNDFLVIASNEESFQKSVDASDGRSLADTANYKDAVSPLPKDRVALLYASLPGFLTALEASGDMPEDVEDSVPQLRELQPVAAATFLRADGVVFEVAYRSGLPDGDAAEVLGMAPRASWAALGVHDLGAAVTQRLRLLAGPGFLGGLGAAAIVGQFKAITGLDLQEDFLSWMGDAAGFLEGEVAPRGGVVIASMDSTTSASAVHRFGRALAAQGVVAGVGDHDATHAKVAFADPGLPLLIQLIAEPKRVWLTFGEETADEIGGATLAGDPAFRKAQEAMGDFTMLGYVDAAGARIFAENAYEKENGRLPAEYVAKVAPNLDPISFVGVGARTQDGVTSYRLMIGAE